MLTAKAIATKAIALSGALWAAMQATDSIITLPAQDAMLGVSGVDLVSKPLFFMALLGASGSVFVRQVITHQADAMTPTTTSTGRALSLALKMGVFTGSVLVFALLAASLVTIILDWQTPGPTIHSSPGWIAMSFVLGVLIQFLPKKLIAATERAIDVTVDAYERLIGGGKP